jgi:class 3 adenylate cyclase
MTALLSKDFLTRSITWNGPVPEPYSAHFSLNRIMPGVDNFRYDVHLSPVFQESVSKIIFHLLLRVAEVDEYLDMEFDGTKEKEEFKQLCRDIMLVAVKKAKMGDGEVQIDYLAQVAVCKLLIQEINKQFENLLTRLNNQIWEYESTEDEDVVLEIVNLKEKVLETRHKRSLIISEVSREIFQHFIDSQKSLDERREANYGTLSLLNDDIFKNPILHIDSQNDDYFMLENYVLLGNRIDDPDKYDTILRLISEVLGKIRIAGEKEQESETGEAGDEGDDGGLDNKPDLENAKTEGWIREVGTIDLMLDYFQTRTNIEEKKSEIKQDEGEIAALEELEKEQKKIFNFFYDNFKQKRLLQRIVASYEMKPIYHEYCPPLVPHQVLQYLTSSDARKSVMAHLKRLKVYYGKSVSMVNLKKTMMRVGRVKMQKRQEYLLQFLKGFFRYHRDLQNFKLLKQAVDRISLVTDEKTIALSKTNNTLYEFLLSHEQVFELETKPVTSHVIMKADVRGATAITKQLAESGLNPASYFSLNFFNPISEIVSQYAAHKVFIEGDAIILAILERKDDEADKYCVSRACGLAINMLSVIQRYNAKSKKYNLPILELGVGICYKNSPPAYLLDGKKRIMISPAINLADRLSSCHKALRKVIKSNETPFNLYVYHSTKDTEGSAEEEYVLRYNVNGIELSETGFNKLAGEIDLKTMICTIPEIQSESLTIHTGKFPLVTGTFQRIIIREDWIREMSAEDYQTSDKLERKYYEVCTHRSLKDYVEKQENQNRKNNSSS